MQTQSLTIRLSKAESGALRGRARRELRADGANPEAKSTKSGYDVIKHLIGKLHGGPGDLSTHPRHMRGFGE